MPIYAGSFRNYKHYRTFWYITHLFLRGGPGSQIFCPDCHSTIMGMQNLIKIYQKVQVIGQVSLSEFEPRQNLDQSQMSFDSLIGYILSISMCFQNVITIFFTVQEIGPFSPF